MEMTSESQCEKDVARRHPAPAVTPDSPDRFTRIRANSNGRYPVSKTAAENCFLRHRQLRGRAVLKCRARKVKITLLNAEVVQFIEAAF